MEDDHLAASITEACKLWVVVIRGGHHIHRGFRERLGRRGNFCRAGLKIKSLEKVFKSFRAARNFGRWCCENLRQ